MYVRGATESSMEEQEEWKRLTNSSGLEEDDAAVAMVEATV
jgi:hypothetical protein